MQPVTIVTLLAFYALVGGYAYVASNLWLTHNPLLWMFMITGALALVTLVYEMHKRRTIGRLDFFVTFAIAMAIVSLLRW